MKKLFYRMKKETMMGFSLLLALSFIFPTIQFQQVAAETSADKIVLGYYASWAPPENLDPHKVTHINYAFADVCWEGAHGNPNNEEIAAGEPKTWACEDLDGVVSDDIANGTIVLYDSEVDLVELKKLAAMKSKNPNLKTLVSVGGWTLSNNLSLVAADEEARETFAKSAVAFVKEFAMDGLDLDWEYPNHDGHPGNHLGPEDTENHTKILQAVRDAFDEETADTGKEYLVTIAGAQTWTYAEKNELAEIAKIVDYMAIMTYDTNGTWSGTTGHNAPLYDDPLEAERRGWLSGSASMGANVYQSSGVPAEKILIGLPFYGHAWAGCNEPNDGAFNKLNGAYQDCGAAWEAEPSIKSNSYDYIKSIVNKDGYKFYFDNIAKVPYLYNEDKGEFISYDNVESLGYKINFVKENGFAGAMIWDLGTDDADYNLLKAVSYGLGVSSEAPEPDPEQPGDGEDDSEPEDDKGNNDEDSDGANDDGEEIDGDDGTDEDSNEDNDDGNDKDSDVDNDNDTVIEVDKDSDKDSDDTNEDPVVEETNEGKELPETATNLFNLLLIGSALLIAGIGFYIYQKRKNPVNE